MLKLVGNEILAEPLKYFIYTHSKNPSGLQ